MSLDPRLPFSRFGTAPRSPRDDRDHVLAMYLPGLRLAASGLPDEVGTANVAAYPGIRNQGMEGTCTGHAARSVKQTMERRQRRTRSGMSRVPEMGPRGIYKLAQQIGGYEGEEGAYMRDVCEALLHRGMTREKDWPYRARFDGLWQPQDIGQPVSRWLTYAKAWRIGAYARLNTVDEILFTLHHGGPVFMAMDLHESFMDTGPNGKVPLPAGEVIGGHAMAFLGASQSQGEFITANSWDIDWADKGFCRVRFDHFQTVEHEAWAFTDYLAAA